jgi:low density lipoprotein-related protein 2
LKIYKGTYSSTGRFILQPVISGKIQGPFSLAIDWITDQIYLVQQAVARIDVFSADGLNRTNLITSNIRKPSSIALDPSAGFLFFTDIGSSTNKLQPAKIERAFMDGSNRRVIIKEKLLEPIAITLDQIKQRIYWIDRKYDHLETADYFGSKRFIIASGSNNLPHSTALDIFENTIYYADSTKLAIMKLGRHTITSEANITSHYKLNNVKPRNVKLFHQTKQSLARLNPCKLNNSGCEHFCLLSHSDSASMNNYRCRCKIGYQLRRDLKTCEPISEFLLLSQSNMIRAVSLDQTVDTEARLPSIMPRVGLIRSLEVDCKNNRSFYYDPIRRAIFQSSLQIESVEDKVLIPDGLSFVENLAYDWISNNLYFTNGGKITVVQVNNPSNKRVLIDKSQVYGLALDPNSGFLFFSTVSRPAKIYRALLDGTNLTAVVQSGLSLPYTISIDYQSKRIYWADSGLARIQSSDYEGNNIVTILSSGISTPMSLNVFKFNLYFIDSRLYNIYKMPKFYSSVPSLIDSNINNLYQIKVFSKDVQTSIENHPCSRQNGDCSHLCFAVPSLDPRYKLSRHCGCPYGMRLDNDMATCINNPDEPKIERCQPPNYFKCNNNRCVRRSDVCDGLNDCLDFSDEASCTQVVCPADYFRCRNGTCIPQSKRCDGRFDCIDFSDEIQCVRRDCDRTQFKCTNGTCIPRSWMCDTENDCGDSSDESNCTVGQCDPLTQFECHGQSGRCIDRSFVCDGANDCINNYDEENCQPITCSASQFKCILDNICINSTKRCDGYNDCPSLQDEQNCNQNPIRRNCRENEFRCQSTTSGHVTCLPQRWVCDGHKDCPDGSDEPATCPRAECSSGYFRCNNSNCIPQSWTCDGENDCGDNSDERLNCPGVQARCGFDQLKCLGSMDVCINKTQLCNQVQDCPDGSDEGAFCSRDDCSIRNGGCSHSCHRSPMGAVCFCPIGFETTNETNYKKCQDIDECKMETTCSQRCANFPGSFNCLCDPGYFKSGPNSCKAVERNQAKVFVTNGRSLIISDIDGTYMRVVRKPYVMNEMTAFDFNNQTKRIYWADKTTRAIYSSNENGTNAVKLVSSGIGFVESLAVDWIGMNLYWADYVMQHIEVSNLDGQRRKILFNVSDFTVICNLTIGLYALIDIDV